MAIKIIKTAKPKLKKPILIDGFPGLGLVGTVAASYLVEKLKMQPMGYIDSEQFPPLAAVHNYMPHYPARLYFSQKHNLIILLSEFIVPISTVHELSEAIYSFAKKEKVSKIISLGGITIKGEQDMVYVIASDDKLRLEMEKLPNVQSIKEGATTGVTGVLLARGAVEKFPIISLLAEAHEEFMDPKAASMVLETLKGILKLDVNTHELEAESAKIHEKMQDVMDKAKASHAHYKKAEEKQSLGPMYG